jgi:hypothetical protein
MSGYYYESRLDDPQSRPGRPSLPKLRGTYLPDGIVSILADFTSEYLQDQLTFALVSSQYQRVMFEKFRIMKSQPVPPESVIPTECLADYFGTWSQIRFNSKPDFATDEAVSRTALSFYCKSCRSLIITQSEVDSPHYHGGYGPAFLAHRVYNCHHSDDESYETQFTTGVYRVCDVTCCKCSARVGKKYVDARDPANQFKVGKILLEQTLLTMPKCCSNRRSTAYPPEHYFCSREGGLSVFCSVCLDSLCLVMSQTVLDMTSNLTPVLTNRLLSLLSAERSVMCGDGPLTPPVKGSPEASTVASPVSNGSSPTSIRKRVGDALSRFIRRSHDDDTVMDCSPSSYIPKSDLSPFLSHCIGGRVSMLNDRQNWIFTIRLISDLCAVSSRNPPNMPLARSILLESVVTHCGPLTAQSTHLLLSRVTSSEDRRSIISGVGKNEQSLISRDEYEALLSLVGSPPRASSPNHKWAP